MNAEPFSNVINALLQHHGLPKFEPITRTTTPLCPSTLAGAEIFHSGAESPAGLNGVGRFDFDHLPTHSKYPYFLKAIMSTH